MLHSIIPVSSTFLSSLYFIVFERHSEGFFCVCVNDDDDDGDGGGGDGDGRRLVGSVVVVVMVIAVVT